MKRYIKSAAMKRSDIGDYLEEQTLPLIEALAQLYLFPDSECKNHWRQEVWSTLYRIKRIKGKHKRPKADFIIQNTWKEHQDNVITMLDVAVEHENQLIPDTSRLNNSHKFESIVKEYIFWLAEQLSSTDILSPKACYNKLEELGL